MRLRWPFRHRQLDGRLAEAQQRADSAARELAVSRMRARARRETVVKPLRRRAEENQFAELLRYSLQAGYRNGDRK